MTHDRERQSLSECSLDQYIHVVLYSHVYILVQFLLVESACNGIISCC